MDKTKQPLSDRQAYNLVTDTVVGPNVRRKDNLYQALVILVFVILGAGLGVLMFDDYRPGLLCGAFGGLVGGVFGSGIFLMIYRVIKHSRGQHD
jgi:hypothetical protein